MRTCVNDGAMGQNKLVVSSAEWALGGNLGGKGLLSLNTLSFG